ncbi:XRE family transcriptional regulator [Rhizobium sp. RU36D]|uniref:LexA family transcriptional regulator n=1 Tax=Rhizobium sp. RU36D TaxID=1907415 RepID=UPI0009D89DB1|nr:XRE family transcriptional regulator [Rhizobium sp. RU36D]SMD18592.1 Phage repressor protein C, contains Cro/C1-type HTH and peptisase s24 domains [Rhizobium sp. RU36D]
MVGKQIIPANNIEALRRSRKMSMDALGELIGTDASTINKIEKRKMRLSTERLLALAQVFGVSPGEIVVDLPLAPQPTPLQPVAREDRAMMPIMGVAAGSLMQGSFQISDGPVDYVELPKALEHARGIYGLYIDGTSMEPMFRHGSLCVVSEYKPPRVGDAVVIQERRSPVDPLRATIGILDHRNGEKVVLTKLNPAGKVEIPLKYVHAMHKVLDHGELLGV